MFHWPMCALPTTLLRDSLRRLTREIVSFELPFSCDSIFKWNIPFKAFNTEKILDGLNIRTIVSQWSGILHIFVLFLARLMQNVVVTCLYSIQLCTTWNNSVCIKLNKLDWTECFLWQWFASPCYCNHLHTACRELCKPRSVQEILDKGHW